MAFYLPSTSPWILHARLIAESPVAHIWAKYATKEELLAIMIALQQTQQTPKPQTWFERTMALFFS